MKLIVEKREREHKVLEAEIKIPHSITLPSEIAGLDKNNMVNVYNSKGNIACIDTPLFKVTIRKNVKEFEVTKTYEKMYFEQDEMQKLKMLDGLVDGFTAVIVRENT